MPIWYAMYVCTFLSMYLENFPGRKNKEAGYEATEDAERQHQQVIDVI